jgi:hypothetical protein
MQILAAPFAGIAGDYESIATVTVGAGGAATITFSSIPATYKHLQIRYIGLTATQANVSMTFNNDTASNYSSHQVQGNGASVVSDASTSAAAMFLLGLISVSSTSPVASIIDILDYADTNKYKTVRALTGQDNNASGTATDWRISLNSGNWRSTSAITRLDLSGTTFAEYSSFALYGIKG